MRRRHARGAAGRATDPVWAAAGTKLLGLGRMLRRWAGVGGLPRACGVPGQDYPVAGVGGDGRAQDMTTTTRPTDAVSGGEAAIYQSVTVRRT